MRAEKIIYVPPSMPYLYAPKKKSVFVTPNHCSRGAFSIWLQSALILIERLRV